MAIVIVVSMYVPYEEYLVRGTELVPRYLDMWARMCLFVWYRSS